MAMIKDRLPPYFTAVGVAFVAIVTLTLYAFGEEQAPGVGLLYIASVAILWYFDESLRYAFPTKRWSDLWHPERRVQRAQREQGRSIGFICDECHKWCMIPVPKAVALGLLVKRGNKDICADCVED